MQIVVDGTRNFFYGLGDYVIGLVLFFILVGLVGYIGLVCFCLLIFVIVFGGYLGVGKIMFVNWLLVDLGGWRIGVFVNDIGVVSIDAELIREVIDDLVLLVNGCICCMLIDGFVVVLDLFWFFLFDAFVVECSGVVDFYVVVVYV